MNSNRPVVLSMPASIYQVDLRAKHYDRIRSVVSGGKKVLQFPLRKDAESKADEIAAFPLPEYT